MMNQDEYLRFKRRTEKRLRDLESKATYIIADRRRVQVPRCQATTGRGTQCLNSAKLGSDYCGIHEKEEA